MPFTCTPTAIADVVVVESRLFHDGRGFFREGFRQSDFAAAGLPVSFVQDNVSRSCRHVVRGLHFQRPPKAQGKLVSVANGSVIDVAVDIRAGSPTFGRWVAEELSAENARMLWIPAGFAHGFCVLSETADLTYKCTEEFSAEHDGGFRWDDPAVGVDWGIDRAVIEPILSDKDLSLPALADCVHGFTY